VRLALRNTDINQAGAELAAVSVDDDIRQVGMSKRWKLGATTMISDPGGATILEPLGLYDPDDRDGIALPGMVIIDPEGDEVYRYQGRDFADRTNDDDIFEALATLNVGPVDPGPWTSDVEVPEDLRGYFRPKDLGAYFRGNMFGAIAIGGRLDDPAAQAIVNEHRKMAKATLDAWETHDKG